MTNRFPRRRCAGSYGQSYAEAGVAAAPGGGPPGHAWAIGAATVAGTGPAWHRVVRYTRTGRVLDWVEVGQCARCGRGVDREFRCEYREVAGTVLCRACAPSVDGTDDRARGVCRNEPPGAQGEDGPEIGASPEGTAA